MQPMICLAATRWFSGRVPKRGRITSAFRPAIRNLLNGANGSHRGSWNTGPGLVMNPRMSATHIGGNRPQKYPEMGKDGFEVPPQKKPGHELINHPPPVPSLALPPNLLV